jgi:hypothetical protein
MCRGTWYKAACAITPSPHPHQGSLEPPPLRVGVRGFLRLHLEGNVDEPVHRTLPGSIWSAVGDRPSPDRFP